MKFDTRTLCLVWQKIDRAARHPPLFHERVTPATLRRRRNRFLRWLGPYQLYGLMEAYEAREFPRHGARRYARHWPDAERQRRLPKTPDAA